MFQYLYSYVHYLNLISGIISLNFVPQVVDDIRRLQQDLFNKSFLISEISKVEKIIADLEHKILDFFFAFDREFRENQFIGARLNSLLYFKGFPSLCRSTEESRSCLCRRKGMGKECYLKCG